MKRQQSKSARDRNGIPRLAERKRKKKIKPTPARKPARAAVKRPEGACGQFPEPSICIVNQTRALAVCDRCTESRLWREVSSGYRA